MFLNWAWQGYKTAIWACSDCGSVAGYLWDAEKMVLNILFRHLNASSLFNDIRRCRLDHGLGAAARGLVGRSDAEKGAKFRCEKEKDEDTRSQLPSQSLHVFDVLNWIYSLPFTGFSLFWQQSLVFPVQSSVFFSGQQGLVTSMYTFTGAILACARFRGADGGLESGKRNMQLFVKQTFQVVKWFHI